MPWQEDFTKHNLYFIALFEEFAMQQAKQYEEILRDKVRRAIEIVSQRNLYRQLCGRLGSEDDMEKLNLLTRQRFLLTTSMAAYLQGLSSEFIYLLTCEDVETGKPLLRL